MKAQQLCLFPNAKGVFNNEDFESKLTLEFMEHLRAGIESGWNSFQTYDLEGLDPTTRASMLNNKITYSVFSEFNDIDAIKCIKINGERRRAIVYGAYIFFFKKYPVSTWDGKFVNEIKRQNLDKHVITISYVVDATWGELLSVDFQYIENDEVTYSLPVYSINDDRVYLNKNKVEEKIEKSTTVKLKISLKNNAK